LLEYDNNLNRDSRKSTFPFPRRSLGLVRGRDRRPGIEPKLGPLLVEGLDSSSATELGQRFLPFGAAAPVGETALDPGAELPVQWTRARENVLSQLQDVKMATDVDGVRDVAGAPELQGGHRDGPHRIAGRSDLERRIAARPRGHLVD